MEWGGGTKFTKWKFFSTKMDDNRWDLWTDKRKTDCEDVAVGKEETIPTFRRIMDWGQQRHLLKMDTWKKVSWDQLEFYPSFFGPHAMHGHWLVWWFMEVVKSQIVKCIWEAFGRWALWFILQPPLRIQSTLYHRAAHQRERFIVLTRDSQAILLTCDQP